MVDRVAAVVAESPEIAEAADNKIKVDYEVLKPVLAIEEAMAPGAPIVRNAEIEYIHGAPEDLDNSNLDPREEKIIYRFPIGADPRKNLAASAAGGIGDINKGFEEADVILESEYETTQVHCTPLEPHVVYTRMDGDRLIIHASTQTPWCIRRTVARALAGASAGVIAEPDGHPVADHPGRSLGDADGAGLLPLVAQAQNLSALPTGIVQPHCQPGPHGAGEVVGQLHFDTQ